MKTVSYEIFEDIIELNSWLNRISNIQIINIIEFSSYKLKVFYIRESTFSESKTNVNSLKQIPLTDKLLESLGARKIMFIDNSSYRWIIQANNTAVYLTSDLRLEGINYANVNIDTLHKLKVVCELFGLRKVVEKLERMTQQVY